jgi:hypothetical protein
VKKPTLCKSRPLSTVAIITFLLSVPVSASSKALLPPSMTAVTIESR